MLLQNYWNAEKIVCPLHFFILHLHNMNKEKRVTWHTTSHGDCCSLYINDGKSQNATLMVCTCYWFVLDI